MAGLAQPPRNTVADFMALPEGTRAELVRGALTVMTPGPFLPHQWAALNLYFALRLWANPRGAGHVLAAPTDVHLPSGDIVQPDVLFVTKRRAHILQDWVRSVPDLVVEVLSPDDPDRDRLLKRDLYAENAVPEYWIVDPAARTVEVLLLEGSAYARRALYSGSATLTSFSLPGFSPSLDAVFRP